MLIDQTPARNAGFTLVEVLVAMSIFTVCILGVAVGSQTVIQTNQKNYFHTIGTSLAQDKMEELKANPASIVSGGPITDIVSGVTFTRNWTVTANSPIAGVKQMAVTVTWTNYGSQTFTISSALQG